MFYIKHLFYFILVHLIVATPQINLYYTDWASVSDNALQHDCLRVASTFEQVNVNREIMSYCMSELPSKFNVENDHFFPKFTFGELSKLNITSQQLYLWSAPMDVIERYQFYLNHLSTSNDSSLAEDVFYNCTMPRFGPMCQYQLHYHYPNQSSLWEIVDDFYRYYISKPTNFTCYIHLKCNRGPFSSCLDWSEICDGKVDCLDGGFDEEHCWQLEINKCKDNEYRCINGQCIPQSFSRDEYYSQLDCVNASDQNSNLVKYETKNIENPIYSSSSIIPMSDQYQSRCHRGLDLRVWLNNKNNLTTNTCLCPPSYYGDRCQYQNQRINLTIQFRALSDSWQTLFVIVISLIDDSNERIIHSYEQITYLMVKNCKTKFNIDLLYLTRPKDPTKHYSIQLDIYEKVSLAYRGSLIFPVTFPFLPVHRLAFIVDIPRSNNVPQSCSNDQCVHGKCIKYSNNPEHVTFCQCNPGWSGRYCTIPHPCMCASDSLCIGVSANNRSICVCPLNKFGPRCLLTDTICLYSRCQNGGQCIPDDSYMMSNQKFICVCPQGFSGDRCEIADSKLILSFDKDIALSHSIFIHFIDLISLVNLVRATTFQTIPVKQDSVIIYWSQPFHLVFTELFNKNYYLTIVQKAYNPSSTIAKLINPSDRCPHISELFNETFVRLPLLDRIKYYHLPCQRQSLNLSCFYDDVHFCLCYDQDGTHQANCFNFDHNMAYDCSGHNACENGAQCLQDRPYCPTRSMCVCPPRFYGTRCQFITSGFGLSLGVSYYYYFLLLLLVNW